MRQAARGDRRRKTVFQITVPVVSGVLVGLVVWSFTGWHRRAAPPDPSQSALPAVRTPADTNSVTLPQRSQVRAGIVVAPLQAMSYRPKVRAYGTVLEMQNLSDLKIAAAQARAKLDEARAGLTASHAAYVRLQALYREDRNVSQKSLQQAEATWQSDEAAARAAEVTLHSRETIIDQKWGPTIGTWLKEDAAPFVLLMEQVDVLIQITLAPETTILAGPEKALIETPRATTVTATFISASPRTNPRVQGLSFFYRAPREASGLLPGMNVLAYLPAASEIAGVYVPNSAVVWYQGRAWIYLQTSAVHFVRHALPSGTSLPGGWLVETGLSVGQWCVVQGAQLLLAQESRAESPPREED